MTRQPTILALASGAAFALYPALRPWGDTHSTPAGLMAATGSPLWLVAHTLGMLGFVALAAALIVHATASRARLDVAAAITGALGAALVLPYYGAEAFALHALAGAGGTAAQVDAVRNGPFQLTVFGLGLGLVAAAGVLTAVSLWRRSARRWAGLPLALALVSYLPQFFAPPALRIAHGALLLVGLALWGALGARRRVR